MEGGINTYAYVGGNPAAGIDPSGLACISKNHVTTCLTPDGFMFQLPTPPGFPDYMGPGSSFYHAYDVRRKIRCANANSVMQGMIDNPTPGSPSPATLDGTTNNATLLGVDNIVERSRYAADSAAAHLTE